jgi:hypothetical protein
MMKKIFLFAICAGCLCTSAFGQNTLKTNDPNTISQIIGGTNYRLICVGDNIPRLYINGAEVATPSLNAYSEIITMLQAGLFTRQETAARKRDMENSEHLGEIVNDLISAKIIPSKDALNSFRLDQESFLVNGQKQSFTMFSRFKTKYLNTADKVYAFNDK